MAKLSKIEQEASEFINEFVKEFQRKFSIAPQVLYTFKGDIPVITLEQLEEVVDVLIKEDPEIKIEEACMKLHHKQGDLVMYRQSGFKIARDMGYKLIVISRYFTFDHATVYYSCNVVNKLLAVRDPKMTSIYNLVTQGLKERFSPPLIL